jgi:hypothetical protein
VHLIYHLDYTVDSCLADRVSSESDTEFVIGPPEQSSYRLFALIVDVVGAEVDMLELHVFQKHPALYFLSL